MSKLAKFKESPWGSEHEAFQKSDLTVKPAPEYASSEVLLSALYRKNGLDGVKEKDVPINGRELLKRVESGKVPAGAGLLAEDWSRVLQGSLESPKLPNQSTKRFLQLTPLVPEVARYSGSARLAGNPWSPGDLVERMILFGAGSEDEARSLWKNLHGALAVTEHDDVWARWVESEFRAWQGTSNTQFTFQDLASTWPNDFQATDGRNVLYPAKQFVRDLAAITSVKPQMTRRQWTSLLESVLRIASTAHVMWLADVNHRVWSRIRTALEGLTGNASESAEVASLEIYPSELAYFPYGSAAMDRAKILVSKYLYARLGINAVLWGLEDIGHPFTTSLSCREAVEQLACVVKGNRLALQQAGVLATWQDLQESEVRTLSCTKGIGSNMLEFVRHCIGQRQTARDVLRGYDQGYSIRKKSSAARARWIVGLGPVAVIAMAHCCLYETGGARSVHRLCDHLSRYGILINKDEVAGSDLGQKLRLLGLVLDSPDAESGMLVIPPFARDSSKPVSMTL
jgi:hypothetical protein